MAFWLHAGHIVINSMLELSSRFQSWHYDSCDSRVHFRKKKNSNIFAIKPLSTYDYIFALFQITFIIYLSYNNHLIFGTLIPMAIRHKRF